MTEAHADRWFANAPKDAVAYVRATAAAYLAQRGTLVDPIPFESAARDAFIMACSLAARFWPTDEAALPERK